MSLFNHTENKQNNYNAFVNSLPASDNFCHLLIIFANSLDPDQDRQNVGLDQELNCLKYYYTEIFFFFKKVTFFKNVNRGQQKHEKIPNIERLNYMFVFVSGKYFIMPRILHM